MAKILLVTGDAAESLEVMYPYQRMLEEGHDVQIAAPAKKKLQFVVHDFVDGFDTYTEKLGYTWPADIAFKDVHPEAYDALIIPGGRAPEHIRMDADARRIVKHFADARKPIAAICHAAQLLAAADVLQGRRSACYPAVSPELTKAGGTFVDEAAVVDDNIVSARAWPDHPQWMRAFVNLLRTRIPANV
ncbi:DJ-1/PfpI family protein [bacterium]|nr:MAG: DJ-1/PfpI family protein [bacterium]